MERRGLDALRGAGAGPLLAAGVGCASGAALVFEVVLTSVFAVTQFHHFAFLAVSLALLGFGASGAFLTAWPRLGAGGPRRWIVLSVIQAVSVVIAYAVANAIPFDSFAIAWERVQVLYLALFLVALCVPFLVTGLLIGSLLANSGAAGVPANAVYAASLIGSGAGAALAVVSIGPLGGEGVVVLSAMIAMFGALLFSLADEASGRTVVLGAAGLVVLLAAGALSPPAALDLRLSEYKDLSAALRYPGAEIVATSWSASGRVDHLRSDGIRSVPGLSFTFDGAPPRQDGIAVDGDDLAPIPITGVDAGVDAEFARHVLGAAAYRLRPAADVLVLEPRGGLDVVVALSNGARSVRVVEPRRGAVDAVRRASGLYDDERVDVVVDEPRAHIERTEESYDVIDLALTSTYRPVASGAYSLAEDYSLTVEAVAASLDRLRPGGVFTAMRWLQTPPSEETRLIALAAEAVRERGGEPAAAIIAFRSYANLVVLISPDGFTATDVAVAREFAAELRFDVVLAPGSGGPTNSYNRLPVDEYHPLAASLVGQADAAGAVTEFDVTAPTDDHPYFAHHFTWSQTGDVLGDLGHTWQPFGGAGYFVLVVLLVFALVAGAALIVLPLAWRSRRGLDSPRGVRLWTVGYFAALGIGFLFVENPLAQRYVLLVGQPTTALATVLAAILLATGVGSLLSPRFPWQRCAGAVPVLAIVLSLVLGPLTTMALGWPLGARVVVGGLLVAPLGIVMGVMFPRGVAHLADRASDLVPWAWGINGVASVISAVSAALIALSSGFRLVMLLGAGCYVVAAILVPRPGVTRSG